MTDPVHVRSRDAGERRDITSPPLPERLAVGVYDNHTHLEIADGDIALDYREHLDRASSVGVRGVVQVGTDVATSIWSAETAAIEPRMLAAVAIHPNEAPVLDEAGTLDDALSVIAELATRPRVRAIGETGLDFYRTAEAGRPAQYAAFEAHIQMAKDNDLALQIHDRDAHADTLEFLKQYKPKGVVHAFSGSTEMAREIIKLGLYIGVGGVLTFKNAHKAVETAASIPLDRIVLETDCPYMAPEPFRGKRNDPGKLYRMAEKLAEIRGISLEDILNEFRDL